MTKRILFSVALALSAGAAFAQDPVEPIKVVDGAYERVHTAQALPVPTSNIREADALYAWRIWRVVDLKQKQNLPLNHPNMSLTKVVLDAVKSGQLNGYIFNAQDDAFENPLTPEEAAGATAGTVDTMDIEQPDGSIVQTIVPNEFNPEDVKKFRLKEEWVFDKQTSTMQVRILGIAPVGNLRTSSGEIVDEAALYWIYFPALRPALAKAEVFNWKNDAARITFDDLFVKRLFSSYIIKESNVRDERIQDYSTGRQALLESEKIKHRIIDFEQALWEY